MDFSMSLARTFGMPPSVEGMPVRNMGMMSRLLMRPGLMMFSRFDMMVSRLIMVACGSVMMFYYLFDLWHLPPPWMVQIDL